MILGWTPFLDPLHAAQPYWYVLLVPFSVLVAMVWKALRVRDLSNYWRQVAVMATLMILGMVALATALTVLIEVIIPMLPVRRA